MSKTTPPAFQFYANDFMDITRLWDANAVGLHVRCMCVAWTHGSIPSDQKVLARAIHCDLSELQACWSVLSEHWTDNGTGGLVFAPQEAVRVRQQEVRAARKAAAEKRWSDANAHANTDANAHAKKKQRKEKEKEKIEREEEGEVVSEPRAKKTAGPKPDHRDPNVQAVIDHLTAALQRHGRAAKLDPDRWPKGQDGNRIAAKRLPVLMAEWIATMQANGKLPPDGIDPMDSVRLLIDRTVADSFDGPNATKVGYLTKHFQRLAAKAVATQTETTPKNQTDEEYLRSVAEASARRAANLAAGIDAY